jgi:hypothetical protein
MKLTDIPSPGLVSNGPLLRSEALKALNYSLIQRDLSPESDSAKVLQAFFTACADALKPKKKEAK